MVGFANRTVVVGGRVGAGRSGTGGATAATVVVAGVTEVVVGDADELVVALVDEVVVSLEKLVGLAGVSVEVAPPQAPMARLAAIAAAAARFLAGCWPAKCVE